jgi:hypothetical protein
MSSEPFRYRIAQAILCVMLVPILYFLVPYLEFRIVGTKRLKEAMIVDEVIEFLDPIPHRVNSTPEVL